MCGIVGYVGKRPVQDLLLAGLKKLEYRGYDSAGISVIAGDEIESLRAVGNLQNLFDAVAAREHGEGGTAVAVRTATTGIGHTRWATHGRVNEENAHPHFDTSNAVHVVVNGIVENYVELKRRLQDMGAVFTSETDAEVIAHLVAHHTALGSLEKAVIAAFNELEGHFAFVAMRLDEPDTLVGVRKECPLVVGLGEGETFLASAIPAFLSQTRRVQYIENDEIVVITPDGARFLSAARRPSTSARSRRSTGTRRPPRRAASTPSCSRRSTSRPTRSPTRSRTARRPARTWTSTTSARSTRTCCAGSTASSSPAAAPRYHAGLMGRYALEEWAADPHRHRRRLRVPLPQAARRARRPRDRHDAVGRDRRHARGDARRARGRRHRARRHQRRRARRPRATPTACSTPARAWRSASRRRRRSSARSP